MPPNVFSWTYAVSLSQRQPSTLCLWLYHLLFWRCQPQNLLLFVTNAGVDGGQLPLRSSGRDRHTLFLASFPLFPPSRFTLCLSCSLFATCIVNNFSNKACNKSRQTDNLWEYQLMLRVFSVCIAWTRRNEGERDVGSHDINGACKVMPLHYTHARPQHGREKACTWVIWVSEWARVFERKTARIGMDNQL